MKTCIVNLMSGKRLLLAGLQRDLPDRFTGNGWFKRKRDAVRLVKKFNRQAQRKYATHTLPGNTTNLLAFMMWLATQDEQPAKVACVVMNELMFERWTEKREELYRTSGYNRLTRWDSQFEKVQQIWAVFLADFDNYTPDADYERQMNEVADA